MSSIPGLEHLEKEGWELVRVGMPVFNVDWIVDPDGKPRFCDFDSMYMNRVIIRKIVLPKQYRAFANAAEFKPHRDRWLMHPREPDKRFKPGDYNDQGVWGLDRRHYDYQHLFECGTLFDDGSPFGVEVTS